jgi:hypothetical protein
MLKKIKKEENIEHFKFEEEENIEHFKFDKSWSPAAQGIASFFIGISIGIAFFLVLFVIYKIYKFATIKKTQL